MPYYVVFTTKPKSSSLSREIAADSTITATLLRQVTIDSSQSQPSSSYTSSTPPTPPSSATEDSDSQGSSSLYIPSKKRLLKRMVRSAPPTLRQPSRTDSFAAGADPERNKPLPDLPIVMQDSRILHTEVSVGFPKRPRNPGDHRGHGSVEAQTSLPDGLFKGKMHFSSGMLPTIDWAGLSVRYYLDVSVLFGQDEMRSRIPIRLY
ncbi:hypothetical protein BC834DRAFT_138908 [Gloeopeniophorella convolvens]|nr:hypothetical protein BC834DRAFT_138908 [Gloeopeniophorella convolvens]